MALQQRHVETERSQLLCHVSGFALHPSELILQVLRDEDVVCVGPDSRSLVKRRRTDAGTSSAVPFFPGHGSGFFAALSVCGAIFASCQSLEIQTPNYAAWGKLRQEATSDFHAFNVRLPVRDWEPRGTLGASILAQRPGQAVGCSTVVTPAMVPAQNIPTLEF